jgi:hypothetical protein
MECDGTWMGLKTPLYISFFIPHYWLILFLHDLGHNFFYSDQLSISFDMLVDGGDDQARPRDGL